MKTKRIDNFLYCFQLETGGLFLGWFGIVGSIFATLICILMIVGLSQFFTDENLQQMGFGDSGTIDNDRMSVIRTVLLICFSLGIFYAIVNFVISIYLIRGTKNKNQQQLKVAVIFFAFSAVLSIFGLINLSISALFNVVYNVYAFVIVYSLWRKFQADEDGPKEEEPSAPAATIEQIVI